MRWNILLDITKLAKTLVPSQLDIDINLTGRNNTTTTDTKGNLKTVVLDSDPISETDRIDAGTICKADNVAEAGPVRTITTSNSSIHEFNISAHARLIIRRDYDQHT